MYTLPLTEFVPGKPIIIGITGRAGSGKTSTASGLMTNHNGRIDMLPNREKYDKIIEARNHFVTLRYDHITHALPLYEFASIRNTVSGVDVRDRQLWQIHSTLYDIFGPILPYDEFIELVYDIYSEPIEEDGKPRTFLQNVGAMCRAKYTDCFAEWVTRKIYERYAIQDRFYQEEDPDVRPQEAIQAFLISDTRFINEVKNIKSKPNSFVVKLTASNSEIKERLFDRDGKILSAEQLSHPSEMEMQTEEFDSYVDLFIDTDNVTLEEQIEIIHESLVQWIRSNVTINTLFIGEPINA